MKGRTGWIEKLEWMRRHVEEEHGVKVLGTIHCCEWFIVKRFPDGGMILGTEYRTWEQGIVWARLVPGKYQKD